MMPERQIGTQNRRRKDRDALNQLVGIPATVPTATGDIGNPLAPRAPTHEDIARRAYQLYEERGGEHGRDREDSSHCLVPPDAAMTGIAPECWLFTRGPQSVRLVREENSKGCHLFVYGPGTTIVIHEFADVTECMKRQAEIEQTFLAEGYQLAQLSSERRGEHRRGADHRRVAS